MRLSNLSSVTIVLLCACSKAPPSEPHEGGSDTTASSAPVASSAPSSEPAPATPKGSTPAIRDAESAQVAGAFDVRARLLVSKITTEDALSVAFAFTAAPGKEPPAGTSHSHAWNETLASLKFHVTTGGATSVLQLADQPAREGGYLGAGGGDFRVVTLTGAGIASSPWKTPAPKIFATPGNYTLKVEGQLSIDGAATPFALRPIPFEVAAASETFKPLAALATVARAAAVATHAKGKPVANPHVVDDASDNRWHRFTVPSDGYDIGVVEVLLSPAGAVVAQNGYEHFTCVAAGTPVDTPRGSAPIESLRAGDTVIAFDLERRERTETLVIDTRSSIAVELVDLGGLVVTPSHPVYADGTFTPAGRLSASVSLLDRNDHPVRIEPVAHRSSPTQVVDISVGWPHNFYAAGFLVHNKAAHVPLGPRDDRWRGTFSWSIAASAD